MPNTPLINGTSYSWANIKLNLFGTPVVGITAIKYKKKQEKVNNYGAGTKPVSRGYGNEEYEASITLFMEEWRRIIEAAPDKDPLAVKPFQIQVLFGGSSIDFRQDNLEACEFMEDAFDSKQGDSKILIEIPLIIADIKHIL